jgi:hypothetical protein
VATTGSSGLVISVSLGLPILFISF